MPDGGKDGLPNLVEDAFGFHPRQNSAGLLPAPQEFGDQLSFSFTPPADGRGIFYGAEWSRTLLPESWVSIPDPDVAPRHRFSVPTGSKPKRYLRLKVTGL